MGCIHGKSPIYGIGKIGPRKLQQALGLSPTNSSTISRSHLCNPHLTDFGQGLHHQGHGGTCPPIFYIVHIMHRYGCCMERINFKQPSFPLNHHVVTEHLVLVHLFGAHVTFVNVNKSVIRRQKDRNRRIDKWQRKVKQMDQYYYLLPGRSVTKNESPAMCNSSWLVNRCLDAEMWS